MGKVIAMCSLENTRKGEEMTKTTLAGSLML